MRSGPEANGQLDVAMGPAGEPEGAGAGNGRREPPPPRARAVGLVVPAFAGRVHDVHGGLRGRKTCRRAVDDGAWRRASDGGG